MAYKGKKINIKGGRSANGNAKCKWINMIINRMIPRFLPMYNINKRSGPILSFIKKETM